MNGRSHSTRRSRRDPDAIAFARGQSGRANEFAHAVWQIVRKRQCRNQKFRREYPIPPYTADFCCVALRLIVEVDGEHHQTEEGREGDELRDRYLAERGYALLRIPGYQVLRDPAGVRCLIETAIDQRIEHLGPLSASKLKERGRERFLGGGGIRPCGFVCMPTRSDARPHAPVCTREPLGWCSFGSPLADDRGVTLLRHAQ